MIKARVKGGGTIYLPERVTSFLFSGNGEVHAHIPGTRIALDPELMTQARLDAYQRANYEFGDFTNVGAVVDGSNELPDTGTEAFENSKLAPALKVEVPS